jgi:outer membrane autotransporter protein
MHHSTLKTHTVTRPTFMPSRGLLFALALPLLCHGAFGQMVDLGTAGSFGVLAGSGITVAGAVQTTTINGDIGTFPTTTITGLGNITLNGVNHAGDAVTQQAKNDLVTAYNSAAGRAPTVVLTPGIDVGGLTLVPGVYKDATSLGLTGALTLNALGNPDAVFIFQIGSTLVTASNSNVILIGGAQACHIIWQVGSSATLGTNSTLKGSVLALTSITLDTGATVEGRLLARDGAVTLDTNTITVPKCLTQVVVTVDDSGNPTKVEVIQNSFTDTLHDLRLTPNQAAVAGALDQALFDRRQGDLLAFLDSLPLGAVPSQLDRLAPEEFAALFSLGFAQFDTEVLSVQQRLSELRDTPEEEQLPAPSPKDDKSTFSGKDDKKVEVPLERRRGDRWGFFLNATGEFASLGDTSGATGFDSKSAGTTIGMDVRLSRHFVLGLTVGYSRSESDLVEGGKITSDGGKAAVYALYHQGGFFTEALIGGGTNSYDTRRAGFGGRAYGDTEGQQFDAYLGGGYDFHLSRVTLPPMASLLYTRVGIDGFDERGSLAPLHIESQEQDSLRSRVGLRAAYTAQIGAARVTPSVSAQWQHEYLETELPIDARFANGAGGVFTVHGPEVGRDSALLTAAVNVAWSRYACHLAYQADLGRTNYENQTVLVGLRVSW